MTKQPNIICCTFNDKATLDAGYWNNQYKANQTGWDLEQVSPPLKIYFDQLTDKSVSILIAGCGNAYEAEYLYAIGFRNITLVDFAEDLVKKLRDKFSHTSINILHQDFFTLKGKFDLIIEQTLFCAIDPKLRTKYVATMYDLLNEKGKLVGLLFDTTFEQQGPPFGGSQEEYENVFKHYFDFHTFQNCYNSIAPRQGTELFMNLSKKQL